MIVKDWKKKVALASWPLEYVRRFSTAVEE